MAPGARGPRGEAPASRSLLGPGAKAQEEPSDAETAYPDAQPRPLLRSLRSSRHFTLCLLLLVFISNQACRALPFYLVDFGKHADAETAMNMALHFRPLGYGIFATICFNVPFTVGSLVFGVLADSTDRMCLTGIAALMWSCLTLFMAAAHTFPMMLGLRLTLGLCQSITNPAAFSLIADLFPESRATMNSVFGLGIYLGTGLASLGAGLDGRVGWRTTCAVYGLASGGAALASFLGLDPRRRAARGPEGCSGGESLEDSGSDAEAPQPSRVLSAECEAVAASPPAPASIARRTLEATEGKAVRLILLASMFRFCAGFAILVWLPAAVRSRFPGRLAQFSVYNSLVKAIVGGASSLAGGMIADALQRRGFGERGGAVFCTISSLVSAPLWFLVLSDRFSFEVSMGFLLVEYLAAESWLGPAIATLQGSVRPDHRGSAQGVFSALTALGNALPACLGLLPVDRLADGLQVSVAVCYLLSAVSFAAASACLHGRQETEM